MSKNSRDQPYKVHPIVLVLNETVLVLAEVIRIECASDY